MLKRAKLSCYKAENVYLNTDASFQIHSLIDILQQRLEVIVTVLKSITKHKHTDHIWDSVVQQ